MTSTTGEHASWYVLDNNLTPVEAPMPLEVRRIVDRIGENCEPSLVSVLFLGGAGGSLRAGVTENPVLLTRAIKSALVNVTCGGAPAYVWPGGGITVMADVLRMPDNSFGTVPTPAIVAPIEFSMRRSDYEALGGHIDQIRGLQEVLERGAWHGDWGAAGAHLAAAASRHPLASGPTADAGLSRATHARNPSYAARWPLAFSAWPYRPRHSGRGRCAGGGCVSRTGVVAFCRLVEPAGERVARPACASGRPLWFAW